MGKIVPFTEVVFSVVARGRLCHHVIYYKRCKTAHETRNAVRETSVGKGGMTDDDEPGDERSQYELCQFVVQCCVPIRWSMLYQNQVLGTKAFPRQLQFRTF